MRVTTSASSGQEDSGSNDRGAPVFRSAIMSGPLPSARGWHKPEEETGVLERYFYQHVQQAGRRVVDKSWWVGSARTRSRVGARSGASGESARIPKP